MRRSLALTITLLCILLALAMSSSGFVMAHTAASHQAATHTVKIVNIKGGKFAFSPATITIKVGQTVTWKNKTGTEHTATANNFSAFNTNTIPPGHTASHKFKKAGTFKYHCTFHTNMLGTVKVTR
jgi:plastocyanin